MKLTKQNGFAALLAVIGFVGAAAAADLPQPMYTKAPPAPPPLYNWSGFYLGVNVGGSWGRQNVTYSEAIATVTNSVHPDGVIGGGQIGWNWQGANSPWVFGLEADIQGSGQQASTAFATLDSAITLQDKLEWFGTVRGRVGYATGDQGRWLLYATGGLAYGENNINGSGISVGAPVTFDASHTDIGWTVGGGVEWGFAGQWSAKLEYLYAQFEHGPTITLPAATISEGHLTDNIVRVGVNYRFGGGGF
jgi:outer membrane immunogenic protein